MPATGSEEGLVDAVIMCDYDRPNNRNASVSVRALEYMRVCS